MTETNKHPIIDVVCAVLLDESGHVLVARRPLDKSLGGLWEFPGGKVEEGESLSDALVREIHEELGTEVVEADGIGVLGTFDHALSDAVIRLHPIICRLAENAEPPEALEHLELRWVPVTEETDRDWAPGDLKIFAALLEWHQKSWRRPPRSTKNLIRVLFWMTFLGYGMIFSAIALDYGIVGSWGFLLFLPAMPLLLFVDSFTGDALWYPTPTLNFWHNFAAHTWVALQLAFNAYLLARMWRWLTK